MNISQNRIILFRKAKYMPTIIIGIIHTIAIPGSPALSSSYRDSRNKRKSNNTLPLFSFVYVDKLFVIYYFAWLFSIAVRPI